ncbi:hypothetical protein ACWD01_13120 [Streptomyces sp. NPDC002835]
MSARDQLRAAGRGMAAAGRRVALGTGLLLHGAGGWISPGGCGPLLVRSALLLGTSWFAGTLAHRAPAVLFAVPVLWLYAAWVMSDSSATPPPLRGGANRDVYAGERIEVARVVHSPEGVMCTLHPVREEVTER